VYAETFAAACLFDGVRTLGVFFLLLYQIHDDAFSLSSVGERARPLVALLIVLRLLIC
jgi:hypothetical protein